MKRSLFALSCWLLAPAAFAILDTNNNGVSDLWEREFNDGNLFDEFFDPQADPDADGWTNAQEAAAGTDPFDPNPPDGIICLEISQTPAVWGVENGVPYIDTPEAVTVTWPTIPGKRYHLLVSTDLSQGSWIEVPNSAFISNGNIPEFHFTTAESDKLFWRVAVSDTDSDGDGLTDAEEYAIGSSPYLSDTDGDGMDDMLEYVAGFSPTNGDQDSNGSGDGWDDSDGDGYSNMEELAAGTDPHNESSRPDGIATDTLVVRSYTVTATYRGACGSKRFAFPELFREAGQTEESAYRPHYYLKSEQESNYNEDVKEEGFIYSGNISLDLFETRQKSDDSRNTIEWSRQGPAFFSSAAVNHFPSESSSGGSSIQRQGQHLDDGLEVWTYNDSHTYTYDFKNNPESEASEETGTFFTYPPFTKASQSYQSAEEFELLEVSKNSPTAHKMFESYSGTYALQGAPAGIGASLIESWYINSSSVVLSNEYTDAMLEADVDESLQAIGDSGPNGGYGNSPIVGNGRLTPRGLADFGRSNDHADVLKQDALYHLSAIPTTAGVKKIVFIWPEVHTTDAPEGTEVAQSPKLKIMRVEKVSASSFPVGQPVQTDQFQLPHPEDPGFIGLGGTSSLECPNVLRVSYAPSGSPTPNSPLAPISFHVDRSYQDLTVTLESTGSATLKLWSLTDGTYSEVPLPYTLKREQKAGRLSKPASFLIQGITTGNNILSLKHAGQQIAFRPLTIIDLDLDIDSDNSGTVDRTLSEDEVENLGDAPGKILVYDGGSDADSDGVPNRDDLDDAGDFVPIELKLDNLSSTDRVVFHYSQSGLGTERTTGCLRLWTQDGTQERTEDDLVVSGGDGYSLTELGVSTGGTVTLYAEVTAPISGEKVITISSGGFEDSVKLSVVDVECLSRDKYLAGSFEIPAGWDDLSVSFVNTSSQEDLGTYGNLTGGGTTKIYDSVDDIMNDADILAGSQPATQKVWFIRNTGNPRKLDYYTCFNSVGTVEIRLSRGGQTVLTRSHELTTADDFAETIRYVDDWVKGVGFEFSGGGTPPVVLGAPPVNGFGGSDGGIDNLTRAAVIPFFTVINQVEGLAAAATGLFDGVRAGINDDWQFLLLVKSGLVAGGDWAWQQVEAELLEWKNNPVKRAGELKEMAARVCKDWVFEPLKEIRQELSTWDGFKNASWKVWKSVQGTAVKGWTVTRNVWKNMISGLINWGNDFCDRMMTGAEKAHWDGVPWVRSKLDSDINQITRQANYTFGYVFGYISEQVAVGALSAGTVKVAQVATKGGVSLAANLARRTAANVAARAHFLKRLLAEATTLPDDLVAAYQRGFSLASTGPTGEGMDKCAMYMMQQAADAGKLVWRDYVDNIVGKTNIRQFVKQGGDHIIERQFSRLIHILGDEFTEQIGKNFLKVADEFILVKQSNGTVNDFFEGFFKAMEGNPSLIKHADDVSVKVGGASEALSPNAKARLKQFLSDPEPGNPWKLDVPDNFPDESQFPIPHNYWARGLLIELQQYKKLYKKSGYTHHPSATGYDYKGVKWVQMKSVANPNTSNATARMEKAITALATEASKVSEGGPTAQMILHVVTRDADNGAMRTALDAFILNNNLTNRFELIIERIAYP